MLLFVLFNTLCVYSHDAGCFKNSLSCNAGCYLGDDDQCHLCSVFGQCAKGVCSRNGCYNCDSGNYYDKGYCFSCSVFGSCTIDGRCSSNGCYICDDGSYLMEGNCYFCNNSVIGCERCSFFMDYVRCEICEDGFYKSLGEETFICEGLCVFLYKI
ncbi:hypothetical protein QTN25_008488 [Entamoeba marina]